MKRLIASIVVLLTITAYLMSCEKDDLCADGTPTTPRLIVEFFKKVNPSVHNPVTGFVTYAQGTTKTDTISGFRMLLPLKTDADEVTWALQYNYTDGLGQKISNTDLFTVKYTRKTTYISRACGYKTTFELLPDSPTITDDPEKNDGLFIQPPAIVLTPNIETENDDEVHVQILF